MHVSRVIKYSQNQQMNLPESTQTGKHIHDQSQIRDKDRPIERTIVGSMSIFFLKILTQGFQYKFILEKKTIRVKYASFENVQQTYLNYQHKI